MRITVRDLKGVVRRLNAVTCNLPEPYSDGHWNVGTYVLSGAYGGWQVQQIVNSDGAVRTITSAGHSPAREVYYEAHAYLQGYEDRANRDNPQ